MEFQDYINLMKKDFPKPQFKDMFKSGGEIVQKIKYHFHNIPSQLSFSQTQDKANLLKKSVLIKQCSLQEMYDKELEKLPQNTNFWLMIHAYNYRVYDCQKEAMIYLINLVIGRFGSWKGNDSVDFYITDKKYKWAVYFKINSDIDMVSIYKCGDTPCVV
jgi:hypothetical protein